MTGRLDERLNIECFAVVCVLTDLASTLAGTQVAGGKPHVRPDACNMRCPAEFSF